MKQLFILALLLFVLGARAQESDHFELIQKQLTNYFKAHPSENIYLQTDRDLYHAGDVVWFSAFVENPSKTGLGSVSDNLVVCLYDTSGEKLNEDKYKMVGGLCKGDFELPENIKPGCYVLAVYSGGTQTENEVFMRQLYIDEFNSSDISVQVENEDRLLVPGESAEFMFVLTEMSGKAFDGKVSFDLCCDGKAIASGKAKTEDKGLLRLKVDVPLQDFAYPLELVLKNGASEIWSSWFPVESEKVNMSFDAEGGHFLEGTAQKLVFRPVNSFGWPVNVEVELQDKKSGKVLAKSKTLTPGFGIVPMTAEPGKAYQMTITSGPGKGQQFDLPTFEPNGLSFILNRLDEQFIYCSLHAVGDVSGDLNLAAFRGDQLIWGTQLKLENSLNLKIPKADFPQGLCQLMVFDQSRKPLVSRLIYVNKNEKLDVEGEISPELVALDSPSKLKLKLSEEALVNFSIVPEELTSAEVLGFEKQLDLDGWLEWPLTGNKQLNETMLNYMLVGNRFKNLDWDAVMTSQRALPEAEGITRARLEDGMTDLVKAFALQHNKDKMPVLSPEFCLANPFLFQKVKPKRVPSQTNNSYLSNLRSGSSVLDAIKMIKPFTMQGDLIIFPGGNNSFMAQDGALIVIDGQKMGTSAGVLASISPYDVESIDISTKPIDILQYTGLNSVGLIDIKTKKGERVVVTDNKPMKEYSEGNRVPRDFAETVLDHNGKQSGTLLWEPAAYVSSVAERQLPAPKVAGNYRVRVWAVNDAGKMGTKELMFEVK